MERLWSKIAQMPLGSWMRCAMLEAMLSINKMSHPVPGHDYTEPTKEGEPDLKEEKMSLSEAVLEVFTKGEEDISANEILHAYIY